MNVQIYEGVDGIKKAYREALGADRIDIVCLSQNYEAVVGDFFEKEVSPKLYGDMVTTREILPDTTENREYAKSKKQKAHTVRFLKQTGRSESDMMVMEDKVILVSFDKTSPFATVITDANLVSGFRMQFEALWNCLK